MQRWWFLTWTSYGSSLPGDPRGSVTSVSTKDGPGREHDQPGTPWQPAMPGLHASAQNAMRGPAVYLTYQQAQVLFSQLRETAVYRGWWLQGVAIIANHLHLLVRVPGDPGSEALVRDFKSYGGRALNRRFGKRVSETWWSSGGGTRRRIKTKAGVLKRVRYLRKQPNPLLVWLATKDGRGLFVVGDPGASAPGEVTSTTPAGGVPRGTSDERTGVPRGTPLQLSHSPAANAGGSPSLYSPAPSSGTISPQGNLTAPKEGASLMDKTRLGRGLDTLIPMLEKGADAPPVAAQIEVPLDLIQHNPYQPRKSFDADELASLSASVKNLGILQPLVVRKVGEQYQLIAGERRLRAAHDAGLAAVPVRIVDFNDQQIIEAALVENIQRADLNPIEKAHGFKDYLERFKISHEQLAQRLGLARTTIANLVNLLDLEPEVQEGLRTNQISEGHAKLLKGVKDRERQLQVYRQIVAQGLTLKAAEPLVREGREEPPAPGEPRSRPEWRTKHVQALEDELRQKLAVKAEIVLKAKDKGQIILRFESNDDFMRLLEVLRR
jgi:ParB family transcriptional regulator, chromosome partitioning protein